MHSILRHVVYYLYVSGAVGGDDDQKYTTSSGTVSGSSTRSCTETSLGSVLASLATASDRSTWSPKVNRRTCPSQMVNHITHSLPQQCLRADRVSHRSKNSTSTTSAVLSTNITNTSQTIHSPTSPDPPLASHHTASTEGDDSYQALLSAAEAAPESTLPPADASSQSTKGIPEPVAGVGYTVDGTTSSHGEEETGSPLDVANFLSFEEWKKQNLAKLGQSPDDVGRGQPVHPGRSRPGINNALEMLGEEGEIELDFSGFGRAGQASPHENHAQRPMPDSVSPGIDAARGSITRSKDAGKTCKERTNYASFDCSATILKSNKECKSASAVLVENKDSYMLNTCSATNKFFIVQLCNDIQVDTIVLANYEFFSSSFRHFRVSVSDRYPVEIEKWRDLGTFEARNTREIQPFLVQNPLIWAKYLRIEFLSHYGTEYYCPVSLLRVHGTTMIEDYRHAEDAARDEQVESTLDTEALATPLLVQPSQLADNTGKTTTLEDTPSVKALTFTQEDDILASSSMGSRSEAVFEPTATSQLVTHTARLPPDENRTKKQVAFYEPPNLNMTCKDMRESSTIASPTIFPTAKPNGPENSSALSSNAGAQPSAKPDTTGQPTGPIKISTTSMESVPSSTSETASQNVASSSKIDTHAANSSPRSSSEKASSPAASTTTAENYTASKTAVPPAPASVNATRPVASTPTSTHPPQPSTQESFFKSFHKRLQQLESNSTLSLKYIEEQSRILRDAFRAVERRQVSSTTTFLSHLNETVIAELHGFRQAYDQLWQSTVIELEGQRESYQREMLALSGRLTMVADELVWQKRMGIVQSTLLLLCVALVLFGRAGNGYLEVPLMQQMMNKSTSALRGEWESPSHSPSPNSRSPVSLLRNRLWRSKTEPDGEIGQLTDSDANGPRTKDLPDIPVESPSPTHDPRSDYEEMGGGDFLSSTEQNERARHEYSSISKRSRKRSNKPRVGLNGRLKSPLAL